MWQLKTCCKNLSNGFYIYNNDFCENQRKHVVWNLKRTRFWRWMIEMSSVCSDEMSELMKDMKTLVEQTYTMNNATRVILMGHSMGCPVLLYFLHQQTQAWKDKFVRSLVTLSGPWGGAVKTLRLMASGGCKKQTNKDTSWKHIVVKRLVMVSFICDKVKVSFCVVQYPILMSLLPDRPVLWNTVSTSVYVVL